MLIGQLASYDYLYFTRQHGDRPRWREATAAITLATPEPKIVLTTNQPGVDYYLRREVFSGVEVLDPEVVSIESWDINRAGGGKPYMQLLLERALEGERRLYVTLTEPELHEKDPGGGLIGWVHRNGHLMQRYPAWTGPKDMTVFVYEVPTVGANGR